LAAFLAAMLAVGLVALGAALLVRGADWFMDGVGDLALAIGVSTLVLGVVLAGLEPEEMLTAAIASARGAPALAVGNVIGTNVTIATAALGLSALIVPITISRAVRRQALIATLVSVLPIAVLVSGYVSRVAGALMLALFVAYTIVLFRVDRAAVARMAALEGEAEDEADDDGDAGDEGDKGRAPGRASWRRPALLSLGGLAAMAIGGPAIVEGALRLAHIAGLGEGAVGATIVSLGTSAEMIALGISAARKRQADVLVGGILGSFAYNLLVTLGLAAVIRPLPVDPLLAHVALPFMVAAHLTLLALVWRGGIPRLMGGLLVAGYVAYLIATILLH
jgi:cation:H+ antiporter